MRYYYLGIKEPKDKSDMKYEVKAELLQKIIKKQDELIDFYGKNISEDAIFLQLHHSGATDEDCKKGFNLRKELAALNTQLAEQQSTPVKSIIERKDFFESQMEKEPQDKLEQKVLEILKENYFEEIPKLIVELFNSQPDRETSREELRKYTIQEFIGEPDSPEAEAFLNLNIDKYLKSKE